MKTKFFFFLAMLLMSSMGAFAQSETKKPLKGDVNEDGEVNAADVVVLVDIIMKKDVDPNKYYWYIGTENPTSISNIQQNVSTAGWHEIGSSLSGFNITFSRTTNNIEFDNMIKYYVIIPNDLHIYAADGITNVEETYFNPIASNITGYKAYQYYTTVWDVKGIIIKGDDSDNKFYWYIGTENPTSISNIQTDNTKPGWHEIGTSLSGFVLDTNTNKVILDADLPTPLTNPVLYYVVIPTGLNIYTSVS